MTTIRETLFVGVDIETTGLQPQYHTIIEVGVSVQNATGEELACFESLVQPKQPITQEITQLTGITNEMLGTAPTIEEVLPKVFLLLKKGVAVAHNAQFDLGFLSLAAKEQWIPLPQTPIVDTLSLSRALLPGLGKYGLQALAQIFQFDQDTAHRALSDARLCMKLFQHLLEVVEAKNPIFFSETTVEELLEMSKEPITWNDMRRVYGL